MLDRYARLPPVTNNRFWEDCWDVSHSASRSKANLLAAAGVETALRCKDAWKETQWLWERMIQAPGNSRACLSAREVGMPTAVCLSTPEPTGRLVLSHSERRL